MKTITSAILWVSIYLMLVLAPLLILIFGEIPPGSGFWWDFSMALGFSSMAIMSALFFLTARFRRASAPFGIDIIYYFHRYLALMVFVLIILHFLIIRISNVDALGVINPLHAPWYMTAGRASLMLFALIIITSLWRKQLHIHYDEWRMLHIGLAIGIFLLALGHIEGAGYYIDAPAKRWLWSGYTLFWLLLILYIRLIKPWKMSRQPYRVVEVRQERCHSWTLALEPKGHAGMHFEPGQFVWLTLRESPWHIKEHPFSFSSSATHQDRLELTIKELGDFTQTIKEIQIGEIAYLDGPYGSFSTDRYPEAPGFIFIAGGVGVGPIISMLRTLKDRHDNRPVWFIYANHSWEDVIFAEELQALNERLDFHLIHVLSNPSEEWDGEEGRINQDLLNKYLPTNRREQEYFICGPVPMRGAVEQALHNLHVPLKRVHAELFDLV